MTDSPAERELPFANKLSTITTEILAGVSPYELEDSFPRDFETIVDHLEFLKVERSWMSRQQKANALVHNYDGAFLHQVIAYGLVHTRVFQRWTDKERRYLLDRALGEEILWHKSGLDREEANGVYFSVADSDHAEFSAGRITHLESIQKRLRERVSYSALSTRR